METQKWAAVAFDQGKQGEQYQYDWCGDTADVQQNCYCLAAAGGPPGLITQTPYQWGGSCYCEDQEKQAAPKCQGYGAFGKIAVTVVEYVSYDSVDARQVPESEDDLVEADDYQCAQT